VAEWLMASDHKPNTNLSIKVYRHLTGSRDFTSQFSHYCPDFPIPVISATQVTRHFYDESNLKLNEKGNFKKVPNKTFLRQDRDWQNKSFDRIEFGRINISAG
jgi:hypothetical protein